MSAATFRKGRVKRMPSAHAVRRPEHEYATETGNNNEDQHAGCSVAPQNMKSVGVFTYTAMFKTKTALKWQKKTGPFETSL